METLENMLHHIDNIHRKYLLYSNDLWDPKDERTKRLLRAYSDLMGMDIYTTGYFMEFRKNRKLILTLSLNTRNTHNFLIISNTTIIETNKGIDSTIFSYLGISYILQKIYKINMDQEKTFMHLFLPKILDVQNF